MAYIFLDRDGVLNQFLPKDYVKSPQEWQWIPNAKKALKLLNQLNYKICIVSNQSCINRKIISWRTIRAIHQQLRNDLISENIIIEDIIICPHIDSDQCFCRKPKAGMLHSLMKIYQIECQEVIFAGDSSSDIKAGKDANIKVFGLNSGNPSLSEINDSKVIKFENIYALALHLQKLAK